MAAPPTAKRMPTSASSSPTWPSAVGRRQRHGAEELAASMPRGRKAHRGDDHQRDREHAAQRVADRSP